MSKSFSPKSHVNEFASDAILIITGLIFAFVLPDNGNIAKMLSNRQLFLLFLIVISVVPWYLGYMLYQFSIGYDGCLKRIIQVAIIFTILPMVVFLIISMLHLITYSVEMELTTMGSFLSIYGLFFIVLGPLMMIGGYDTSKRHHLREKSEELMGDLNSSMILVALCIGLVIFVILVLPRDVGGVLSFLMYAGSGLLAILVAMVIVFSLVYLRNKFLAKGNRFERYIRAHNIVIPMVIMLTFIFWNDIVISYFNNFSNVALIASLFFCGIVPFRIIMALTPPFSWLSLTIGICSIGVFLYGAIS